jgi:unspecific monooxygenase
LRDPIDTIVTNRARFGDVFQLKLLKQGLVFVCSADVVKEMYTAPDDVLAAGESKIVIFGKLLGSASTLLLDGKAHLARRRLLLPRFRGEILNGFAPLILRLGLRALARLPREEPFALHPVFHATAFDVIAHALFSSTPEPQRAQLLEVLRTFANHAVTSRLLMLPALQLDLGRLSPWGRVLAIVEATRQAVLAEIVRRRDRGAPSTDITGLLLAALDDDGRALTDVEIRDEIMTMVAAGHETTAMALTWLAYAIYSRPAVLARLRAEVTSCRDDQIDAQPYLDAVIRESLRFYSLIPNGSGRLAKRSLRLADFDIPAGTMVTAALHAIHRDARVFERPDEFLPERFSTAKHSPYEWLPFGGGTRRCLGMPFAMLEMKLLIASLVRTTDLEIAQAHVKPTWRGAFLTPSKGLRVRVRAFDPGVRV